MTPTMDKRERVARAIKAAFAEHTEIASLTTEVATKMADAAIATLEPVTVRACAKCGHPENNHPYRHPFVALK